MGGTNINHHKSWHTGTNRNIEKVFKAEEKRADELKRIDEVKRRMDEERDKEEMLRLHETSCGAQKAERVDWIYNMQVNAGDSKNTGPTLPKAEVGDFEVLLGDHTKPGSLFESTMTNKKQALDNQAKLRDDPLLFIKQAELDGVKKVFTNASSLKILEQVKEQMAHKLKETKKKSKKDKKEKKEKKEKKSKKRKHDDTPSDNSANEASKRPRLGGPPVQEPLQTASRNSQHDNYQSSRGGYGGGNRENRDNRYRDDRDRYHHNDHPEHRREGREYGHHNRREENPRRHENGHWREAGDRREDRDRSRREEPVRSKDEHDRDRGSRGYKRGSNVTKGMNQDEIERKLQEMQNSSKDISTQRKKHLKEYEADEQREADAARRMDFKYVHGLQKTAYAGKSVSSSIGSKKFYLGKEKQSMAD